MLDFYWELGADIVEKQAATKWGDGFLVKLSHDLMEEFPEMKGFSKRNLELIRKWYCFWSEQDSIAKQLASQLLFSKAKNFGKLSKLVAFLCRCPRLERNFESFRNIIEQNYEVVQKPKKHKS